MKRLFAVMAALALMLGVASAQETTNAPKGKTKGGNVTQTLTSLENQWTKAAKDSDGDAIAPLLADQWVTIDSDGSMHDKAEAVARAKKAKWEVNEISDLKVMQYGNSAVVTGVWTGKGIDGTGKQVDAQERWADTWVKMPGGKWQCVASASAPMK
jgi:ketosteroid isomerase-like protein